MTVRQPFPKPKSLDEYLAVRDRLVDTLGRPVVSAWCDTCHCDHFTVEPCRPRCPQCGATGARCLRGSEHEAAEWHRARRDELDRLSDERVAAGLPAVALWAVDAGDDLALFDLEPQAPGSVIEQHLTEGESK